MKGHITREIKCTQKQNSKNTRMVQLPATTAIEYVAACLPGGTFSPGVFWPGGLLSGGAFVRGTFSPGVFCLGALLAGNFCPGVLLSGGLLPGGLMPVPPKFNAYTHRTV